MFAVFDADIGDEDELLLGLTTKFEVPTTESDGVAELPELPANGVIRRDETACFVKLTSA